MSPWAEVKAILILSLASTPLDEPYYILLTWATSQWPGCLVHLEEDKYGELKTHPWGGKLWNHTLVLSDRWVIHVDAQSGDLVSKTPWLLIKPAPPRSSLLFLVN